MKSVNVSDMVSVSTKYSVGVNGCVSPEFQRMSRFQYSLLELNGLRLPEHVGKDWIVYCISESFAEYLDNPNDYNPSECEYFHLFVLENYEITEYKVYRK